MHYSSTIKNNREIPALREIVWRNLNVVLKETPSLKKKKKIMEKPEKFKCSKSTGADDLHPRVWKEMKCEIAEIWDYAIRDHSKSHWNQWKDSPDFSENWIRPSQINSEKQWVLTGRCSSPFQVRCRKHNGAGRAVSSRISQIRSQPDCTESSLWLQSSISIRAVSLRRSWPRNIGNGM